MSLQPVPLFGLGNRGKSASVDAQTRVNLYAEVQSDPEKNILTLYPTPCITTFVNLGTTPFRGVYERGDVIYGVVSNKLYSINNAGLATEIGTLQSYAGRVSIADNGTQMMIVDGSNGYIYNFSTLTFTQVIDADFPGGDTVTFFNGRFVVNKPNSGQFYISALYDGMTWDALDFATSESDPDNCVRVIAEAGQLVIFGDRTTEFWGDSGAQDFPYARIGSAAIEWGLAARWSLTKFVDSLIFLRRNRLGQVQVAIQSGSSGMAVSTPEMDYIFSQYSAVSDATGFSYMLAGHPMYQINFPTANESWLYDGQSKSWSKVQYGNAGRHRAEMHVQLLTKNYVTDYENGKLYRFQEGVYTDDGMPVVREFVGKHISTGNFTTFSTIWLEMEAGTGLQLGQGKNPQVMMQIGRNGGKEWGAEVWRDIGAVGKYQTRAVFNRLGAARDWLFKFRVTDPIKTVFVAAWGKVR